MPLEAPRVKVLAVFACIVLIITWALVWSDSAIPPGTPEANHGADAGISLLPIALPQGVDHAAVVLSDPSTTGAAFASCIASATDSLAAEPSRSEPDRHQPPIGCARSKNSIATQAQSITQAPSPAEPALPTSQASSASPRGWYQLPADHPRVLARQAAADWNKTFDVYQPPDSWRCPYENETRWFWDTDTVAEIGVDWKTALTVALTNKTVGIHGDSLTLQTISVFLNLVESAGFELVKVKRITRFTGYFPALNFTLIANYVPYIVDMLGEKPYPQLSLDRLSQAFTIMADAADYMVINIGLHLMSNNYKFENSSWVDAYTHIIRVARDAASARQDRNPAARTFFRLTPPRHFQGGDYDSGGLCNDREPKWGATYSDFNLGEDQLLQNRIVSEEVARDPRLEILDVVPCTVERVDAHRGGNDCVHFCLPGGGPVRVWVEMLIRRLYDGRV
ncbi:hypothetical protein CAOG_07274 [Capsaspora owczarzaki ATCC 30864]|uniref:Trichome birefringence-like C-terminal domain-containing protein n=1 Tax=Capsaspora owczarzaki (strain ATCC 30864) TaxID=595528 RepID=A0A0D2UQV7_CAPO3|nr:hypothetical protein CAOG_07274 [Capsaspora owczarzaki ATCC 30864]KJE97406.1 hypothetical protein CAOG_007274 [Capsaspora owczarzaki ATCC 30864]|eukprot:XP_004343133.1 hypothetical protein CAOG_07274 [Capsaspora owczarzaki ATCC 30864]